jgi:Holliday junction resolvase
VVNKNKQKGSRWEKELVELLNENLPGLFKKVPGSGALGTQLGENLLTADVVGKVDNIPNQFKIECKVGYGGSTQLTIKKEWLDKVKKEADASFSIPVLAGKFSGSRLGVRHFVVLDLETFIDIVQNWSKKGE